VRFVEYSPEALETARRERKPVFLLISAVWCYWCKYFDQHTLETEEVSRYLNRQYLPVFVDHDRRLDLARRYVRGLPMIVLLDPDGRVRQSFAGALTKNDFLSVLRRVEGEVRGVPPPAPREASVPAPAAVPAPLPVSLETYRRFSDALAIFLKEHVDTVHGGFGTGDKHPHPRLLAYLLEQHGVTGDRRYLEAVEKTLQGILRGIYDPVEGGFFRYAEGRAWREPHYEKMVHLNAALGAVFERAYRMTRNPQYREAAEATTAYLLRTLYDARGGGFYGSQTADPSYYRLPAEVRRGARKPPVNREKVTSWNAEAAMAFAAMAETAGRKELSDAALRTLEFLRRHLLTDKGVFHIHDARTGRGQLRGQLEANAWAILAFLEGHRLSRQEAYRQAAERLLAYAMADLFDSSRGAFVEARNPDDRPSALSQHLPLDGNGLMAEALMRAHRLTGREDYRLTAERVLATLGGVVQAALTEDEDAGAAARVADAVFYLRAYAQVVGGSR
jgi:uncharacterized protein YyaL (SSP411 family)